MIGEPIETYVRGREPAPADTYVLLRGSPLTATKFTEHAARTARAYTFRGNPCFGISAEVSRSPAETARLLQGRRLSTRRRVARIRVGDVLALGFALLPTFSAPHYTIVVGLAPAATIDALVALASTDVLDNPYYQSGKEV